MIRREIQFSGQPLQWLLISQVEHARISGLLAEHCLSHLDEHLQSELYQAIVHHDDGWAAWESQPQLDPEHHRPYSFRELPSAVSLPIWTGSINAAATTGPLAGWVVAGHFLALLQSSDKIDAPSPTIDEWRKKTIAQQAEWFAKWQGLDRSKHTQSVADEALRWLQLLDVMSLWICTACPGQGEIVSESHRPYRAAAGRKLETEFYFQQNQPLMKPWRFHVPNIEVKASGWVVPIRQYKSTNDLLAAQVPHIMRWRLSAE